MEQRQEVVSKAVLVIEFILMVEAKIKVVEQVLNLQAKFVPIIIGLALPWELPLFWV